MVNLKRQISAIPDDSSKKFTIVEKTAHYHLREKE